MGRDAAEPEIEPITIIEWLERTSCRDEPPSSLDAIAALEDVRGPWPSSMQS